MLADLDRSRQETEKAKKLQIDAERSAAARYEDLHARYLHSEEELLGARAGQLNLQQALDVANERVAEMKKLLELKTQAASGQAVTVQELPADKLRTSRSLQRRALSQRSL